MLFIVFFDELSDPLDIEIMHRSSVVYPDAFVIQLEEIYSGYVGYSSPMGAGFVHPQSSTP